MQTFLSISPLILLLSLAECTAHDGTINISGTIQDNTCIVSPDSEHQTVTLGTVASKDFRQKGDRSGVQKFVIELENCGEAASAVKVQFGGQPDSLEPALLQIDAGPGSASGLALAILDDTYRLIPLSTPGKPYPLEPGAASVSLIFYAQYISTGTAVTAGAANASATFTLMYA